MADLELTVPEFNLLLTLVHLRGTGTTKDFKAAFGFDKVETPAQRKLTEHGLVSIDRTVRPYAYELTDAGWLAARRLLSEKAPSGVSQRTARILWAFIGDFSAHMDRTGTELADLYPARVEPSTADRIRKAYTELVGGASDWVPLRRLRELLDDIEREEVDSVLGELLAAHEIRLIPESNQKTLTEADDRAAVRLANKDRHLIAIEAL
ncbi:hypothetical protein [Glycomyces xiaoerkulensis]|uniref:hypothetical protein n=1 Tax=Glycomyces xiaoerkulensis TaxID=2038139 RepID=UPI000C2654EF|nr:hypothetical protein [Glycomyces xiaoerkulensis]